MRLPNKDIFVRTRREQVLKSLFSSTSVKVHEHFGLVITLEAAVLHQ